MMMNDDEGAEGGLDGEFTDGLVSELDAELEIIGAEVDSGTEAESVASGDTLGLDAPLPFGIRRRCPLRQS